MRSMPWRDVLLCGALLILAGTARGVSQVHAGPELQIDTDHDGLGDALEQRLLEQFRPAFMVGAHDCSVRPAEFRPEVRVPEVEAEDGTIYGQVSLVKPGPQKDVDDAPVTAEIHYFHLWRKDCGGHGHPLDTEHVAVLVQASGTHLAAATWKAMYWYAAAHEDTVCDVSQIARATTLRAVEHGATVWISPGKHASYLNETMCDRGCGADRCEAMVPLRKTAIINLGEAEFPMNGSVFVSSAQWPLRAKMTATNFPAAPIARLDALPESDIAWVNPGRHPMQGVIAHSSQTEQALAGSERDTSAAISVAGDSTGQALSNASDSTGGALGKAQDATGSALGKSYRNTTHALGSSVRHVGKALHITPDAAPSAEGKKPQ